MGYCLADSRGYIEDFASIGGLADFQDWAAAQSEVIRDFAREGHTSELKKLAGALEAASVYPAVKEQVALLKKHAASARDILIISDGLSDVEEEADLRTAAKTTILDVADAHTDRLAVAVRYGFHKASKTYKATKNVARTVKALENALYDVLPDALLAVHAAGGEFTAASLAALRVSGGKGSGNFGHAGGSGDGYDAELAVQKASALPAHPSPKLAERGYKLTPIRLAGTGSGPFTSVRDEVETTLLSQGSINDLVSQADLDEVDIDSLYAYQTWLNPKSLEAHGKSMPDVHGLVYNRDGKDFVIDGNNRIALRKLGGAKKATVLRLKSKTSSSKIVAAAEGTTYVFSDLPEELRTLEFRFSFNARSDEAMRWAEDHAAELIRGISDTTRDSIRFVISRMLDSDEDISDAEAFEQIREAIGDDERADLIARTEVMRAVHEGQREAWLQAVDAKLLTGNEKRVWITTPDDALCPICSALDGRETSLDGDYSPEVEVPPAHPRCRCTEGLVA